MGQFGNQPDFGTRALTLTPTGDVDDGITTGQLINPPCALYIGTGGDVLVTVVGGDTEGYNSGASLFKNVPSGTFMPVMVSYLWATVSENPGTTASDIIGLY